LLELSLLHPPCHRTDLGLARGNNCRLEVQLDLSAARASLLESIDDFHRLAISDFTEDDMLAIEPRGDDGGDEELGAIGVGTSIGHGQQARLGVGLLEVLIGEFLTVDGLAASTVATSEVTTLKHELRDDTMELRACVAKALLTGAQSPEVLGGLWDYIIVKEEVDAALVRRSDRFARALFLLALLVESGIGVFDVKVDLVPHGCDGGRELTVVDEGVACEFVGEKMVVSRGSK